MPLKKSLRHPKRDYATTILSVITSTNKVVTSAILAWAASRGCHSSTHVISINNKIGN